jgi:hypothetical protein
VVAGSNLARGLDVRLLCLHIIRSPISILVVAGSNLALSIDNYRVYIRGVDSRFVSCGYNTSSRWSLWVFSVSNLDRGHGCSCLLFTYIALVNRRDPGGRVF